MSDYAVDMEALQADARTWTAWADELDAVEALVPYADARLFGTVLGAPEVHTAFVAGLQTLRTYIHAGRTEFDGIGDALRRSAATYARNDGDLSVDARRLAHRTGLA